MTVHSETVPVTEVEVPAGSEVEVDGIAISHNAPEPGMVRVMDGRIEYGQVHGVWFTRPAGERGCK